MLINGFNTGQGIWKKLVSHPLTFWIYFDGGLIKRNKKNKNSLLLYSAYTNSNINISLSILPICIKLTSLDCVWNQFLFDT